MTILVTGGAGYLGSVLVPMLLARGDQVVAQDICMFGAEGLLPHMHSPRFHLVTGDIRDRGCIRKLFTQPFDAVVHLAALVGEPACTVDPTLTRHINTDATISLAREAKKHRVTRFIFSSTCSNYGVSSPETLADETSPLTPLSLYAETKVAAEEGLLAFSDASFSVTVLRFATLYGLSPKMRFNLLINEMVRDAWRGKTLMVYKPDAWRPFIHTIDAARAIVAVLVAERRSVAGQIFNIGTNNLQKKTVVSRVKKFFPALRVVQAGGQPDNRDYRVSFTKAGKTLGFRPTVSIEQGIEELVRALKHRLWSDPYDPKYSDWIRRDYFA